jgi:myo-inositol-1(or 4)-monophosphatase
LPASEPAILADLATILREAGTLAVDTARGEFRQWTKDHDNSPVSDADIAVDNFLRARLTALLPQAGWLSEESEDHPQGRSQPDVWVVDPIDGTRAFLAKRPDWTVSVALIEGGRPKLAALYAPVTDELFLAALGRGATINGKPMRASAGDALRNASIAGPKRYLERLARLDTAVAPQPKVHSLALRLARVAQGALDAALASPGSHDWDIAAGDLLLHEAGGQITGLDGNPPVYNRPKTSHDVLVAAGPARHGALLRLVHDRQSEFA